MRNLNKRRAMIIGFANESTREHPMSLSQLPERVSEALIRATSHHEHGHPMSGAPTGWPRPFSIAISREAGTRGPAVAQAVAERLDWPVYDHELLQLVPRQ